MPQTATNRAPEEDRPVPTAGETSLPRNWQRLLKTVTTFVQVHLWKGIVGLATSAGVAGFFLSPVKDWAYHKLWHERALLQCYVVQQQISVNDSFELDLTVVPQGITVSSGVVEIHYPADKIVLVQPSGIVQTEPIADTKVAAKLLFRAIAHGPASVDIHFNTKYGKYLFSQIVLIREVDQNHHPSRDNLTGTWNLRFGGLNGELHIEDDNGKIGGHYELDDGNVGQLKGVRGVAAFQVSMISNRGEQYAVQCNLNLADSFIELKGDFFDSRTPKTKQSFYGSSHI